MALSASCVWEIRTTGSDTACSGGFVTGASGTDYSQQNAAQYTLTGLTSVGAGNVVLTTSASADMVGNLFLCTGGTNFNGGAVFGVSVYQITAVSVGVSFTCATNAQGSVTFGAGVGGTGVIGGAALSPGNISGSSLAAIVAGNIIHIKAGTYSISNLNLGTSGGPVTDNVGARWYGYQTTRFDYGTQPLLQATYASGSSTTIFNQSNGSSLDIHNIGIDGNSKTSTTGFTSSRGSICYKVYAINCTASGITTSGTGMAYFNSCYVNNCGGTAGFSIVSPGVFTNCVSYNNTVPGFSVANVNTLTSCIAYNNTGATTDGFISVGIIQFNNCTSYANGRAGFRVTGSFVIENSTAEGNTGKGFDTNSTALPNCMLINCAGFNNSVNVDAAFTGAKLNFVTYSSTAFISSTNFTLNSSPTGGALLKAAGIPGTTPDGLSVGYLDIGAIQHGDPPVNGFLGSLLNRPI